MISIQFLRNVNHSEILYIYKLLVSICSCSMLIYIFLTGPYIICGPRSHTIQHIIKDILIAMTLSIVILSAIAISIFLILKLFNILQG